MRLEGWEQRLDALIEDARNRPYELGVHDCFRLTCRVVEALTGVDRWPEFGGYRTEREALGALAAYGRSFCLAGDRFFGLPRLPALHARRGDVLAYCDAAGKYHLGICMGASVALLGAEGVMFVSLSECDCVWRVG